MTSLGDQIRSEADIASRPGQLARLQSIAGQVDAMLAEVDRLRAQLEEVEGYIDEAESRFESILDRLRKPFHD